MNRLSRTLATVLLTFSVFPIYANELASPSTAEMFALMDSDKNGTLSKTEALQDEGLSATFEETDADGNGEISLPEYEVFAQSSAL